MNYLNNIPWIILWILFISAFCMPLMKKVKKIQMLSLLGMGLCSLLSGILFWCVYKNGSFIYTMGHFKAPFGIELYIGTIESGLALIFTLVATFIIWSSVYNIEKEVPVSKMNFYYLLIHILVASLLGMIFSNDLFNCFVFVEVITLSSCGIVVLGGKKENIMATLKYLILSSLGSGMMLMGIAFLYDVTGNLNMSYVHESLLKVSAVYEKPLLISCGLLSVGLGIKSAMFPLHVWLPDAHSSAPSSSSAILSSLVLKSPVLVLMKILYKVFGVSLLKTYAILDLILILGALGMIMGSVIAMRQKEIKRVIAYSSVAQMGYIYFGIGLGNILGLSIAIYHMIGHAVTKSALFLTAGSMIHQTGNKKLKDLKGIGKEMPYTLGLFTLGVLSMVGIPILPGFISKWYLSLASIDAKQGILVGVILLSSLLNAAYYFPIVIQGYFGEENIQNKVYKSKEKNIKELLPIGFLVSMMVLVGVFSQQIIKIIETGLW